MEFNKLQLAFATGSFLLQKQIKPITKSKARMDSRNRGRFFVKASRGTDVTNQGYEEIVNELKSINTDTLTPLEALLVINKIKEKTSKSNAVIERRIFWEQEMALDEFTIGKIAAGEVVERPLL